MTNKMELFGLERFKEVKHDPQVLKKEENKRDSNTKELMSKIGYSNLKESKPSLSIKDEKEVIPKAKSNSDKIYNDSLLPSLFITPKLSKKNKNEKLKPKILKNKKHIEVEDFKLAKSTKEINLKESNLGKIFSNNTLKRIDSSYWNRDVFFDINDVFLAASTLDSINNSASKITRGIDKEHLLKEQEKVIKAIELTEENSKKLLGLNNGFLKKIKD